MSWRTVVISNRCKLDYKMGFMVIRGDETYRVYIDEISILLIENNAVSFTGCLIEELIDKKIKIIFCDSKRSPIAEITPYYGSYDCSRKIKIQNSWSDDIKSEVWREIVAEKIRKQSEFLKEIHKEKESAQLQQYTRQIIEFDSTNREGHAAKVYFNSIFGMSFSRSEENIINSALDYGYSLLLSAFNREIVSNGYLTQIGLFHDNMFNYYNFSCDLMEPYRVIVDRFVYNRKFEKFETEEKHELIDIVNSVIEIDGTKQTMINAIRIYVRSIFEALNDYDVAKIKFYSILL